MYTINLMNKKEYIVQVTNKDIKDGVKLSCFDCPISYALLRKLKLNYRAISVAKTIKIGGLLSHAAIPELMEKWIITFDKGLPVEPFEFKLIVGQFTDKPIIEML
jgi:hypothetical protein